MNYESRVNALPQGIDSTSSACCNQGSRFLNQTSTRSNEMAKANKSPKSTHVADNSVESAETSAPEVDADGYTVTHNPAPVREKSKQEIKAEEAKAKIAAKAEKKAAADKAKADREAEKAAKQTLTAEERAAKKQEREARLAELGKNYKGSMLALADRVKSGAYVKGTTGQLRSSDELATALDAVTPNGVIQLAKHVLNLEANPYIHLNVGQQSMNLRNKMRGAITKGTLTIDAVKAAVIELDLDASASIQAKLKAKADAKAQRDADAKAKADAKAAKAAEVKEPVAETA